MAPDRRRGRGRAGSAPEHEDEHDAEAAAAAPISPQQAATTGSEPSRPKRKKITPEQLEVLMGVFEQDRTPDLPTRQQLAARLNLTNREVQVWFQNKRSALKRKEQAASTSAVAGPSSSRPVSPKESPSNLTKTEWCEPRPYLDLSASSKLASAGPGPTGGPSSLRRTSAALVDPGPSFSPIPAEGVPIPPSLFPSDRARWPPPTTTNPGTQNLPPLPMAMSRSSSSGEQERQHRLSLASASGEPMKTTSSPRMPQSALHSNSSSSSSSRRRSTPRASAASSPALSATSTRRFTGDPPELPTPETDHLNLATSRPGLPTLPLPANLVLSPSPDEMAVPARRPWTGGAEHNRRAELGGWTEREYWTRRST